VVLENSVYLAVGQAVFGSIPLHGSREALCCGQRAETDEEGKDQANYFHAAVFYCGDTIPGSAICINIGASCAWFAARILSYWLVEPIKKADLIDFCAVSALLHQKCTYLGEICTSGQ
jgi:hypothetical protein